MAKIPKGFALGKQFIGDPYKVQTRLLSKKGRKKLNLAPQSHVKFCFFFLYLLLTYEILNSFLIDVKAQLQKTKIVRRHIMYFVL